MKRFPLPAVLMTLLLGACAPATDDGAAPADQVLAVVNGNTITMADVDAEIAGVPKLARPEFSGPIGRSRMLKKMIEEEILYLAAQEQGLDRDEALLRRVEDLKRQAVVQAYLDQVHEEATRVDDAEAEAFYEEHADEYRTEKMIKVRMLLTETESLARRVGEMVAEGQPFERLCGRHSSNPYVVSAQGLIPTWIRRDRAVPWIGNHPAFHEVAFELELDEISDPFQTPAGWHVIRVEDVREARQRPFEEVKKDVVGRISRERSTRGLPELLADLHEKYDVEILNEPGAKSADELFTEAQAAPDPRQRVKLYEELVERFPDFDRSLDACFMIGFIRSEELDDAASAAPWFRKVMEQAPDSDLAQSARFMLESADEEPEFEDDELPPGGTAAGEESADDTP
ncbi:MAG: hypothetical protein HKN12_06350, partial [Gemmatimonadetes bacterium]|nr:hypothetical protein [Gemmatimonadota bacterium]